MVKDSRHGDDQREVLLDSSKPVIATVALKGGGFPTTVKSRQDFRVVTVTLTNRSTLAGSLLR